MVRGKQVRIDHSPTNYPDPGVATIEEHLAGVDGALGTIPPQTITTADPGADDDISEGQQPGFQWLNTTTPSYWVCADNTDGAAVWLRLDI